MGTMTGKAVGGMMPSRMKATTYRVLQHLAAGEFRSGEMLAEALGVSRGTIWHAVRELEQGGLQVYRVKGRGYRLDKPLSLIDTKAVMRQPGMAKLGLTLNLLSAVDSTNTIAVQRARTGAPGRSVIVAEWQTAGRGRHGRAWHGGIAGGLTFSMLWRFTQGAAELSGLSLAVGVGLMRAIRQLGMPDVALKWPNDLVWQSRKLAGILIEMHGDALGPTSAVIGIGINVRISDAMRRLIDQPVGDLETACGHVMDRSVLLATVLQQLVPMMETFERHGFAPFREEWERYHAWHNRRVTISLPDGRRERGVARGIDDAGALLVAQTCGIRRYHNGEVSLHLVARRGAGRDRA